MFHDFIRLTLQLLLHVFRNGQHGRGTERVAGMHAYRIHVLDEADRDHVVVLVPDHFQFQFFPAQDGFFHQHLADDTGLQAPGADGFQFFFIVNQAAAGAAHGIGRAQHHRIA